MQIERQAPDLHEPKEKGWLKWLKAAVKVGSVVAPMVVKNPKAVDIMNQSISGAGIGIDIAESLGGKVRRK